MVEIEAMIVPPCTLGEGPYWDAPTQSLLYVDILDGSIHRYWTLTGRHQKMNIEADSSGATVSFVVAVDGNPDLWLVGVGLAVGLVQWGVNDPDTSSRALGKVVTRLEGDKPGNRFNDAKCDSYGRLWAGTMGSETAPGVLPPAEGSLYRFDASLNPKTVVTEVDLSNGLGWFGSNFYYIDTCHLSVDAFQYDLRSGDIKDRRVLCDYRSTKPMEGGRDLPDGMAVDELGNLWVANYFGQKIINIEASSGKVVREIALPCRCPTSVCWGGEGLGDLYVTSSRVGMKEPIYAEGALLKITGLGTRGLPSNPAILANNVMKSWAFFSAS